MLQVWTGFALSQLTLRPMLRIVDIGVAPLYRDGSPPSDTRIVSPQGLEPCL
jgi:hypothetical protein